MLDKKTERMLQAASMLTAEDLDVVRGSATIIETASEADAANSNVSLQYAAV